MSGNSIGKLFTVTSFGESHGLAIGCIVDGCPPGLEISASDLQPDLDRRKPGQSRYTTQRKEDDEVKILSGVFEGRTTGASIGMMIENKDQKSKDYSKIKDLFRPLMQIIHTIRSMVSGIIAVVGAVLPGKLPCVWPLVALLKSI